MSILNLLWALAAFLLVVGILVVGHEFGHFWVARKLGVRVLRFSVGFGKPLASWRGADGTEYVIAPVPLGGYVRMLDESEGPVADADLPVAFNRQPVWKRVCIVGAGPLANVVLAVVAYWMMFVVGIQGARPLIGEIRPGSVIAQSGARTGDLILEVEDKSVVTWAETNMLLLDVILDQDRFAMRVRGEDGEPRSLVLDLEGPAYQVDDNDIAGFLGFSLLRPVLPPVIGALVPGGRAETSGLRAGDQLVMADQLPIPDWGWWADYVRQRPEQPIDVIVSRDGRTLVITVVPAEIEQGDTQIGRIGASPRVPEGWVEGYQAVRRYAPGPAVLAALNKTWEVTGLTLLMMGKMISGEASLKNVSGPITIAQYAGRSARVGFSHFLFMLGLISIGLAILNLLPIPVLDGGHLLYYLVEFLTGSPVSRRVMEVGQQGGLVILFFLIALALYNDITRWF